MAWYYGTYSCGHDGRVNIIGPTKLRQWIADRKFEGLCPDCYGKYLQEQREKSNAEAAEKAKEMELPELKGTEKQVAWANTLRQKMIDAVEEKLKYIEERHGNPELANGILNFILTNKTNASWYIDNRHEIDDIEHLFRSIKDEYTESIKTNEKDIEDKTAEEVKAEATVRPEKSLMRGAVEINVKDDEVTAMYEKNDDFREIVKSLGYSWDGIWIRKITNITGSAADRAAELGSKLLNAGFPITIYDANIRQKAVNAEYEEECKRWIFRRCSGQYEGWLAIDWEGKNDKLYTAARKIPKSRYDKGSVLAKVEYYPEVQDFAEMFSFKFTSAALKTIEAYKESTAKIETVKPAAKQETPEKDGLKEILNSGSDILDDLKD